MDEYEAYVIRLNRKILRSLYEGMRAGFAIIGIVTFVVFTIIRIRTGV